MATIALAAVVIVGLLVFLMVGALIELHRDVHQLREISGVLDTPLEVDVEPVSGGPPSEFGLPKPLDAAQSALVLFLSESCSTCRALAAYVGKQLPSNLWVVIEGRTESSARAFLEHYFETDPTLHPRRVQVDVDGAIAGHLGLNTTPVGFHIENGQFTRATTIPSTRYLDTVLPNPIQLRPMEVSNRRDLEWS